MQVWLCCVSAPAHLFINVCICECVCLGVWTSVHLIISVCMHKCASGSVGSCVQLQAHVRLSAWVGVHLRRACVCVARRGARHTDVRKKGHFPRNPSNPLFLPPPKGRGPSCIKTSFPRATPPKPRLLHPTPAHAASWARREGIRSRRHSGVSYPQTILKQVLALVTTEGGWALGGCSPSPLPGGSG